MIMTLPSRNLKYEVKRTHFQDHLRVTLKPLPLLTFFQITSDFLASFIAGTGKAKSRKNNLGNAHTWYLDLIHI
jgi:hypothetical protein